MTTEQRIALLAKAREAKRLKKAQADAEKPIPVKGRPKKELDVKTLDLVDKLDIADEEINDMINEPVKNPKRTSKKLQSKIEPDVEDEIEPEIIEEVEIKKIKKPKKRIVRKIIKEQYDSDSTEEEYEEVIYRPNKHRPKQAQPKQVEEPRELTPPREPEIKKRNASGFNLFSY
tara:strand:+ start:5973 stop:6494 length:522 start_codon:yes stop_codon:yes gene_type:complete